MENTFFVHIKGLRKDATVKMASPSVVGISSGAQGHVPENVASEMALDLAGTSAQVVELYGKAIERLADR